MRRTLRTFGLIVACCAGMGTWSSDPAEPRFADVNLKIFTTGDRQPLKEAGAFSSSLPLGKTGSLHRALSITNESKGTGLALTLGISVTPSVSEDGILHCVVLSEALPQGGGSVQRAKDMAFNHPGQQIMELFADPATGTRVALAVSASLAAARVPDAPSSFPPINFIVRVEQLSGAQRVELESLQLQSLDGVQVTHDYQRKVPRWVEGEVEPGEKAPPSSDTLPVLDLSGATPTIKAGEGFSIPLSPKEQERQKKEMDQAFKQEGGIGAASEAGKKPAESPRRIVWDEEFYHLSIEPLALRAGDLSVRVSVRGQILDPATKLPAPPLDMVVEKTLQPGQPAPLYLTREISGGQQGYVLWVVPQWATVPPPGAPSPSP